MSRRRPRLSAEERERRSQRMHALNADPSFRRKGQGEWTPERRAQKSVEMTTRNADPAFHAKKLAGIARKPPRGMAVPEHSHPLVRGLFVQMKAQCATRGQVSARSGISTDALTGWRTINMPQIDTLDAALNALGFELAIVPLGHRNADGFIKPKKERSNDAAL